MKGILKRVLAAAVLLAGVLYLGDYLVLRYRVWRNHRRYGTITVEILYAISQKSTPGTNKTEYQSGGFQNQTCVNSLFPHFGYSACWYLKRRTTKTINI
ncbi:MAG TPA: hypothetical protein VJA94_21985 [Candidatus Angelobacter sp.]